MNTDSVARPEAVIGARIGKPLGRIGRAQVDAVSLGIVYAVSALALAGFAVFGRHPELLNRIPGAASVYGSMFVIAPRAQIAIAFAALAVVLTRRVGARWIPALAACCALSLASELAGTTVGLPFGPYRYGDGLGFKLFGHVPALIPLSWFFMALPCYALAQRAHPGRSAIAERLLLASLLLVSWDLVLDPAMSLVTKYWIWGTAGPYYGMPLLNLFGWYVTGLALMAAFELLRSERWLWAVPRGWLTGFYGANLLLPLGMCAVAGLWGAVALTGAALAVCALLLLPPDAADRRAPA